MNRLNSIRIELYRFTYIYIELNRETTIKAELNDHVLCRYGRHWKRASKRIAVSSKRRVAMEPSRAELNRAETSCTERYRTESAGRLFSDKCTHRKEQLSNSFSG